jgi:hypothetical protein
MTRLATSTGMWTTVRDNVSRDITIVKPEMILGTNA